MEGYVDTFVRFFNGVTFLPLPPISTSVVFKTIFQLDRVLSLDPIIYKSNAAAGALEVIEHACKKAKVDGSEAVALMQPEAVVSTALALFGIDLDAESSSPK